MLPLIVLLTLADVAPRPMVDKPRPLQPEPQRVFAEGPALEPAEGLAAWLDKQLTADGKRRRVRLPVVVKRGEMPHAVERTGFVGSEKGLALELDDTAMGVSLADHVHRVCGEAASCALLLDGTVEKGRLRILWIQKVGAVAPTKALVEVGTETGCVK